ncbi:hypothetical protein E1I18_00915 [Mycoplasmopsis mucosicanis]|uniref:Uncharacterized protein n=1 Tax=Mycoplasmopsis mucosicanis TaxID=458208 RepID=A0A507SUW1_9BACT|nr:hypothetical protein [Mycoplasmopsis mucosicanis]TQC54005.1 hypothetical protein E1I18_00915 [Mycoplasmopsis mucosicanis]
MNDFITKLSNFFVGNHNWLAYLVIGIYAVLILLAVLWGVTKGFWPSFILLMLTLAYSIAGVIFVSKFSLIEHITLPDAKIKEYYMKYKTEIDGVVAGILLLVIFIPAHIISLIIADLVSTLSRITVKKLKKRDKKVGIHRITGALVAPITVLPLSMSISNIAGVGGPNKVIEINDKILSGISNGKIIGISRLVPLFQTFIELKNQNIKIEKIKDISDVFKDSKVEYDVEKNAVVVTPFPKKLNPDQTNSINEVTKTVDVLVSGITKTDESFNVFKKELKNIPITDNQKKQVKQKITEFVDVVKKHNQDADSVNVDVVLPPNINKIGTNIPPEKRDAVADELAKTFLGDDVDQETKKIAKKFLSAYLDNKKVKKHKKAAQSNQI